MQVNPQLKSCYVQCTCVCYIVYTPMNILGIHYIVVQLMYRVVTGVTSSYQIESSFLKVGFV